MSITDDARPEARPQRQSGPPGGGGFDKSPPQDIAAEQGVLGGMLLSKDAVADVVEILKSHDFYRPVHATVFDTILDLYGRGEPADALTVAAALADSGDLQRVGGVPYLHTLIESVPTAANASYYARIVSERAVLRRLVEAGTKIVQLGYGAGGNGGRDVDDIVDLAQQAVYDVTERRVSEDFAVLADMLQPTLDEIEAVGATNGVMTGVPTGFSDLDRLLNGLHPGQLIIVAGRPGLGKALALDTPLATPDGWTTMADVAVGDRLMGADGRPTQVIGTSEIMVNRPCYEVEFSDGSVIVADGSHQWPTHDRNTRLLGGPGRVRTTEEIAETLRAGPSDQRANHSIRNPAALRLPERSLPIAPYTFGVWLGDGHGAAARLTALDPEVLSYVEEDGYRVDPGGSLTYCGPSGVVAPPMGMVTPSLRALGVLDETHIPMSYLRASERQRRDLLAGLLDTDGTVTGAGSCQFSSTSRRLAGDVQDLVAGLGYQCTLDINQVTTDTQAHSPCYTVDIVTVDNVFRLGRKVLLHKERSRRLGEARTIFRCIVDVRRVASVPVKCVSIDNADKLYVAGRTMVPTHNSTASMDIARNAAIRSNCASAIFSLEMSKIEIVMRLLSAEARVPLHVLRSGQLSDDDWTKLARRMGEISEAPIFVDDTPSMNLMEIRAKARRLKQRHDLKLIVVDYLQLMTSPKRTESRQQEVADLSRGLKLLAKEVECPVIAVSQLNRGPEQRTDKRPQLSDLRESGCLTASTRVMRADDNSEVTLGDLLARGCINVPVWALNERLQYTAHTMTHVFPSGRKPVFRLTLTSGKQVEATANHPFLTYSGWKALGHLAVGDRLAAPRHVPPPLLRRAWNEDEIVLLAHLLGNGSFAEGEPIRYASVDEENLRAVASAAKHFGVAVVRDEFPAGVTTLSLPSHRPPTGGQRSPIAEWLGGLGLLGLSAHETFIPESLFSAPKEQLRLFLSHLWSTDRTFSVLRNDRGGGISYSSASLQMATGVSRLLLRFGITTGLRTVPVASQRPRYTLDIRDRDDQLRFLREIAVTGDRAADCAELRTILEASKKDQDVDAMAVRVWADVRRILMDEAASDPDPSPVRDTPVDVRSPARLAPGRERLARIAAVLDGAGLELLAINDVVWDEIESVEPLGEQDVYDATVTGVHNFVANGVAVHNSIEQDADVVILLHRDDYYDKESPRAGEADFIVAKHRNGPTDTVTVAAQLHLSRFVDMAIV